MPAHPGKGASYAAVKTWHEQALALRPTKAQRATQLRTVVRKSKYGGRGLRWIFKGMRGSGYIDPTIPGVEKTVRLIHSASPAQRKGAVRTIVYATRVHQDKRFGLLGVNRLQRGPRGRILTDKDIVGKHRVTGARFRIEAKDVALRSQTGKALRRIKRQIDLMAREYRKTGELQALVNRRSFRQTIKDYAAKRGVPVYENVATGQASSGGRRCSFGDVLEELQRRSLVTFEARIASSSADIGFGAAEVYGALGAIWQDWATVRDGAGDARAVALRLGQHSSELAMGAGSIMRGGATLALVRHYRTCVWPPFPDRVIALLKWGSRLQVWGFVGAQGFMIWQFAEGDLTTRQIVRAEGNIVGGLAGALAGAWVGAKTGAGIGTVIVPGKGSVIGATIGAAIGGVGGALGGAEAARYGVEKYFEFKDDQRAEELLKALQQYYADAG
ncbi:MAG: hypothetical protein ACODAJ_03385 [Planctomycetota bacterium]